MGLDDTGARSAEDLDALLDRLADRLIARLDGRTRDVPAAGPPALSLADAVGRFVADLDAGKAPGTAHVYRSGLNRFLAGLPEGRTVADLTADDVLAFVRRLGLADPPLAPVTVSIYTVAAFRFAAWLVREEISPSLPLERLRERLRQVRRRPPRRLPRVPADDVVAAILRAARERPEGGSARAVCRRLRDVAVLETLRSSGVRVAELAGLRRDDIDAATGTARVLGKGGKERTAFLSPAALTAVGAYLAARDALGAVCPTPCEPLFARHNLPPEGDWPPLSPAAVRALVAVLGRAAGVGEARVTPHRFRAWFASRIVEETGDLAAAQDLLGHDSPATTRRYLRAAGGRLAALHGRVFPADTTEGEVRCLAGPDGPTELAPDGVRDRLS